MILRYQNVGHRALGSASSIGRVIPLDVSQRGSTLLQLSYVLQLSCHGADTHLTEKWIDFLGKSRKN